MNTYRAIPLAAKKWAIEWSMANVVQGLVFGAFDTESEAAFNAYELARMEWHEGAA
jgi:hypothetical protein